MHMIIFSGDLRAFSALVAILILGAGRLQFQRSTFPAFRFCTATASIGAILQSFHFYSPRITRIARITYGIKPLIGNW